MMRAIAECSPLRVMSIRCSSVGICTWRQIYAGSAGSITLPRGFRHLSTLDRGRSSAHNKVRSVGQHSVQSFVWIGRRFLNEKVVNVPNIAESITECDLSEWFKGEGDYVELDEPVASLETDKISTNVNAPGEGIITEIYAKAGETIQIGSKLFKIDLDGKPPQDKNEGERKISPNKSEAGSSSKTEAPKAEAPKAEAPKAEAPKAEAPKTEAPKSPKGDTGHGIASQPVKDEPHKIQSNNVYSREQVIVPMSRIRLKIAERLKDAQNQAAFLTTFNEVDMSAIINMRAKYGAVFLEKHKTKLGFMGVFLKACATALVNNPQVNALMSGKNLIYSDYVDISVAVATDKGLVTPVVRNCNALSIPSIEKELVNLSSKARTNKLAIEDMAGGTFTVSNGGVFGSLMGTPILNPPQSAILGMHATKNRPVDVNGKVEIRPMMYLALTYDHRIIDGKEAVTFLVNIKNLVEDPLRFVLEL